MFDARLISLPFCFKVVDTLLTQAHLRWNLKTQSILMLTKSLPAVCVNIRDGLHRVRRIRAEQRHPVANC